MNSIKLILLGANPKTTIVGYLLAVLTAVKPLLDSNVASTADVVTAAISALITALFGRIASDSKKVDPAA